MQTMYAKAVSLLLGLALCVAAGSTVLWQHISLPATVNAVPQSGSSNTVWHRITTRPISQSLNISGIIQPGQSFAVVAPFDGAIRARHAQFGDYIEKGRAVVELDLTDMLSRLRDAQSAFLKASIVRDELQAWDTSPDVLKARRYLESAEAALAAHGRQVQELEALLHKGIISKNEYDLASQQRDAQAIAASNAREDLKVTQGRGDDEKQTIAELEYENARARVDDLTRQIGRATLSAPATGIIARPPTATLSSTLPTMEVGTALSRGAPIFSLADTTSFVVTAPVDEIDVNDVVVGQKARVQNDVLASGSLYGSIVSVSSEGQSDLGSGRAATYEVRAAFSPVDEAQRRSIRIGMSARLTIETYKRDQAVVIPIESIFGGREQPRARVRSAGGSVVQETPVTLGRRLPEGIEIISGIEPGMEVEVAGPQ